MAPSAFLDNELPPTERQVARILGATAPLWDIVHAKIAEHVPGVRVSWGFTSKSMGWNLRVMLGERVIVTLTPVDGCFLAAFRLNDAAVAAMRELKIPASMTAALDSSPVNESARGLRFAVRSMSDAMMAVKLAAIVATC